MDEQSIDLEPRQVADAIKWVVDNAAALGAPGWFVAGALGLAGTAAGAVAFLSSLGVVLSMSSDLSAPAAARLAALNAAKMREMGATAETWTSADLADISWAQYLAAVDYEAAAEEAAYLRAAGMFAAAEATELPKVINTLRADLTAAIALATQQGYQAQERAAQYQVEAMLATGEAVAHEIALSRTAQEGLSYELQSQLVLLRTQALPLLGGSIGAAALTVSDGIGNAVRPLTQAVAAGNAAESTHLDLIRRAIEGIELRTGDVTRQAPPAPNVSITAPSETGALGTTIAAALPAVGVAMAAAIAATAGSSAHAGQQARYGCMGGFAGAISGILSALLPTAISATVLLTDNPIRSKIQELLDGIIERMTDPDQFTAPAAEADALDNATRRLTQSIGFGMEAQMIAYIAESSTPLKQMGFGQLAGFVGDLAGLRRIAAGLMGTLEDAAIYQPLKWRAQRQFRPALPGPGTVISNYAQYHLTRPQARDYLERGGYDDNLIDQMLDTGYIDPNMTALARALSLGAPEPPAAPDEDSRQVLERAGQPIDADWWYRSKLARASMRPSDIEFFMPAMKMAVLRTERATRLSAITALYRDGYIDRARATAEIDSANTPAPRREYRLAAMDLGREYKQAGDARAIVITAMGRGVITRDTARELLTESGMDGSQVELEVLKGTLGLLPAMKISVLTEEDILA